MIKIALEVQETAEALEKERKELSKRLDKLSLFMGYIENGIPKWNQTYKNTPEPDYSEIGIRMKKERNLQGRLKIAQKAFDMAKIKSESSSPVGKSGRTAHLQKARNDLNDVLNDIEKQEGLIEFYQLRAEKDWLITIAKEFKEEIEFNQIELAKAEPIFGVV